MSVLRLKFSYSHALRSRGISVPLKVPGCWAQEIMASALRVLGAFLLCVVSELERTWYHSSHGPAQAGGWEEAQPHPIPPESFCSMSFEALTRHHCCLPTGSLCPTASLES